MDNTWRYLCVFLCTYFCVSFMLMKSLPEGKTFQRQAVRRQFSLSLSGFHLAKNTDCLFFWAIFLRISRVSSLGHYNICLCSKAQTGSLPIIKDPGYLSSGITHCGITHCVFRCVTASFTVPRRTWGYQHRNVTAISVGNKLFLSLIQESCIFCQLP